MKTAWLQRGTAEFSAVEVFVSSAIWGAPRQMMGDTAMVSIDGQGRALGAVIYQNFHPEYGTIELSAAAQSKRWLSRSVLKDMFDYPFNQLGCQAVILRCAENDTVMGRIAPAYGFTRHDIPRLRGRDQAETIYILPDDVWRARQKDSA